MCRYCHQYSIRYIILGKGCVILNRVKFLKWKKPRIYRAGSGFRFNNTGMQCSYEGFTGLELARGIPGRAVGATYTNAGAIGLFIFGVWRRMLVPLTVSILLHLRASCRRLTEMISSLVMDHQHFEIWKTQQPFLQAHLDWKSQDQPAESNKNIWRGNLWT